METYFSSNKRLLMRIVIENSQLKFHSNILTKTSVFFYFFVSNLWKISFMIFQIIVFYDNGGHHKVILIRALFWEQNMNTDPQWII